MEFIFAAKVFFIFFALHLIQWFVWRRLKSTQKRLISHGVVTNNNSFEGI